MILVDTSVWIDHLRLGVPALSAGLESGQVLVHPFIVGELACGNLRQRDEILNWLQQLPRAPLAIESEVLFLINSQRLMGRGIGYLDIHLLASVRLVGDALLWTRDRRLSQVAEDLGLAMTERR